MALPTIPDVYRITVNYAAVEGVQPANVFHVHAALRNAEEVGEGIGEAAGSLRLMTGMSSDFRPQTISVLPLDGESATSIVDLPEGAWATDSGTGDWSPAVAAVVTFRTTQRGSRGRGRIYLGPLVEEATEDGRLIGDTVDDLPEAWQSFRDALEDLTVPMQLAVASYAHSDWNRVSSINVDPVLATQRRRQDQLRR